MSTDPNSTTKNGKPVKVRTRRDWGEAILGVIVLAIIVAHVVLQPQQITGWHGLVVFVMFLFTVNALVKVFTRRPADSQAQEPKQG